ncbi:hypothetical protein VNO77_02972 [Canavalia gladiata]|uniref:Uncharacterized protein n=1 Tax=Canavalia gladiata TaxID=3824 RepID=A0AAN9R6J1_CANGL
MQSAASGDRTQSLAYVPGRDGRALRWNSNRPTLVQESVRDQLVMNERALNLSIKARASPERPWQRRHPTLYYIKQSHEGSIRANFG